MQSGLDYLPMMVDQIHARAVRTSAVRRWLRRARWELSERHRERCSPAPASASRTYLLSWRAMQACSERELKSLRLALDLVEAYCCDGRRDQLGRALLYHNAAAQAFRDYCRRRLAHTVNPTYLAA